MRAKGLALTKKNHPTEPLIESAYVDVSGCKDTRACVFVSSQSQQQVCNVSAWSRRAMPPRKCLFLRSLEGRTPCQKSEPSRRVFRRELSDARCTQTRFPVTRQRVGREAATEPDTCSTGGGGQVRVSGSQADYRGTSYRRLPVWHQRSHTNCTEAQARPCDARHCSTTRDRNWEHLGETHGVVFSTIEFEIAKGVQPMSLCVRDSGNGRWHEGNRRMHGGVPLSRPSPTVCQ